jgi:hypothetical protein
MRRLVWGLVVLPLLLPGCGDIIESESGKHFAERNAPVPSPAEAEATLNRFEAALREKRPFEACKYLTPRSLREFSIGSGGKDIGNLKGLDPEDFKKGCAAYIAIRTKGVKVPRVTIHVEKVEKEEFKGHYYLVVYPPQGPSIIMNSAGTKIMISAGPEENE